MEDIRAISHDRDAWRQTANRANGKIVKAVELATWGQIDGAHHKTWVIDQMLRVLLGDTYAAWVKEYEKDGEYKWDTGIAPSEN